MSYIWCCETEIGKLGIVETDGAISNILFDGENNPLGYELKETKTIKTAANQLLEYFNGKRTKFDFPMLLKGTVFQKSVWEALKTIPFAETRRYKDIAEQIKNPKAVRAVGMANHCNPIPIVIPCHRVIGSNGSLTGYAGGLKIKQYLLDLEKSYA